jgi:hypothetical protein
VAKVHALNLAKHQEPAGDFVQREALPQRGVGAGVSACWPPALALASAAAA